MIFKPPLQLTGLHPPMEAISFTGVALEIEGLLSLVVQFAEEASLCRLEATAALAQRRMVCLASLPCLAPWAAALARRGLQVVLEPRCSAEEAHRTLKHCCGALRDVNAPLRPQPLLVGRSSLQALESLAASFCEVCPGWPGGKQLLEFGFDPAEVQRMSARDAHVSSRPVRASWYGGRFDDPPGVQTLHLEINGRLAFLEDQLAPTPFLDLCLGERVPEFTWVQVALWGGMRDLEQSLKPELSVFRLLSSGCGAVSLGRMPEGSPLHAALCSDGVLHGLLAMAPFSSVAPPTYKMPPERFHLIPASSETPFVYRVLRLMQWFLQKLQ
mmetsp:Transcript_25046/g.68442  ORF Transcript_25046/g.68442 Transcript_25046/m.68442 type:complete len:328 (-) Transcript_25046:119-1102(-)